MSTEITHKRILQEVETWLEKVVIGLNLCPFAHKPFKQKQIRLVVTECEDENCLLEKVIEECQLLEQKAEQDLETTVIIVPSMLQDFDDYNQFLDYVDALLEANNWSGIFQVASFHPNYQFAGTLPEDAENLTNRSPYPLLHLLREESLEKAIARYPHPELIPDTNIARVSQLSAKEKQALFPYLFPTAK